MADIVNKYVWLANEEDAQEFIAEAKRLGVKNTITPAEYKGATIIGYCLSDHKVMYTEESGPGPWLKDGCTEYVPDPCPDDGGADISGSTDMTFTGGTLPMLDYYACKFMGAIISRNHLTSDKDMAVDAIEKAAVFMEELEKEHKRREGKD